MRTLHVSSAMTWRGGEQQIAYLVGMLALKGFQQWVLCPKGSKMEAYCIEKKIRYYSFLKIASVNPLIGKKIDLFVEIHDIHLVHLHDSHAHTYACIAASVFRMEVPIILSRRVDFPIRRNPLSKWKYNHPAIKKIICVSAFIKKVMEVDIKDKSKLVVVHSGIDFNRFNLPGKDILRKEYKIPQHVSIIANVAAIAPHKDYFTFVKSAELILKKNDALHFFIIGGDEGEEDEINELITKKGLGKKISLTGFREDIPQLLPGIDILLMTSKTEGLGTSLLDAQLCEVPIVSTRAGGIPEIVKHEKTGLLAPVGDAKKLAQLVERLLQDETLRSELIKNARESVQSFSKEAMAEKTIAVYKEVLAKV